MLWSLFEIVVGLLLLVAGGEVLLRGAVALATLARVTPAVIGLTVVAAGTSVPELAVSATAAARGSTDIAVANVVGSNIFNVTLILGLAAVIRPLALTGNTTKLEFPVLAIVTLMLLAVSQDGRVDRLDAVLFAAVYAGFTAYLVSLVRGQVSEQERRAFQREVEELAAPDRQRRRVWASAALVAGGVLLLVAGANAAVAGASQLGRLLGLSERVIGLTIIAGGTGLPEVVTSLVSSIRGRDDIAIGNVIGSNLFNILGTLGLTGLIAPVPVPAAIIATDYWWMLAVTLLLFPLMYTGRRIARWEGVLLLATYGVYLVMLLGRHEATS